MMEFRNLSAKISKKVMIKPRLQIRYPQLTGLPNRKAQHEINDRIMKLVYQMIRDQGYVEDKDKEMTGIYEVMLNENGLISIVFQNYAYTKGAAHGITLQKSLTMDLWDGDDYDFDDLFREGSDYKAHIDTILKRQIEENEMPILEGKEFKGVVPDQDYYLTPRELVVYFQLDEYTPYAYGFPTFLIPYTEITDIANPEGPIGKLQPSLV